MHAEHLGLMTTAFSFRLPRKRHRERLTFRLVPPVVTETPLLALVHWCIFQHHHLEADKYAGR